MDYPGLEKDLRKQNRLPPNDRKTALVGDQVSSFFDGFTESSLDRGAFWAGPMRASTLTPEQGSIILLALGVLGVAGGLRQWVCC